MRSAHPIQFIGLARMTTATNSLSTHVTYVEIRFNRAITLCDHPTERRSLCHTFGKAASLSSEECIL